MLFNMIAAYFVINSVGAIKACYDQWIWKRDEMEEIIDSSNSEYSNKTWYRTTVKLLGTAMALVVGVVAYAPIKVLTK